jgi:hypothetical protein
LDGLPPPSGLSRIFGNPLKNNNNILNTHFRIQLLNSYLEQVDL